MYYGLLIPLLRAIELKLINLIVNIVVKFGKKYDDNNEYVGWKLGAFLWLEGLHHDHLMFFEFTLYSE